MERLSIRINITDINHVEFSVLEQPERLRENRYFCSANGFTITGAGSPELRLHGGYRMVFLRGVLENMDRRVSTSYTEDAYADLEELRIAFIEFAEQNQVQLLINGIAISDVVATDGFWK